MNKKYHTMKRKLNGKVKEVSEKSILMEIPFSVAEIISGTMHEIERVAEEIGLALMLKGLNVRLKGLQVQNTARIPIVLSTGGGSKLVMYTMRTRKFQFLDRG